MVGGIREARCTSVMSKREEMEQGSLSTFCAEFRYFEAWPLFVNFIIKFNLVDQHSRPTAFFVRTYFVPMEINQYPYVYVDVADT